jgi:hypothetical protein
LKIDEERYRWTYLGLDSSKSGSNLCCTLLLSVRGVTNNLDLLAVLPDLLETWRVADVAVGVVEIVVFLTNDENGLRDVVLGINGRIATFSKLVLYKNL